MVSKQVKKAPKMVSKAKDVNAGLALDDALRRILAAPPQHKTAPKPQKSKKPPAVGKSG